MHVSRVTEQFHRFYDGGAPGEPADRDSPPRIVLERHDESGVENFSLSRTLGYDDRELGELLVPARADFRTDLTSVPWLFTWLVPRTGAHLPAALLHDGLVGGRDGPASYLSVEGHVVARDEADRVFRDAMADTGTGVVRRWLVWTAVTTATIFLGSQSWSLARWWGYRLGAAATIGVVLALGSLATLDLVDAGVVDLPWMGDRVWWSEVLGGFAGAVAIPFVLGLGWGRFRVAGAITGVLLAVLLHVTFVLLVLTALYQAVEHLTRRAPTAAWTMAGVVVTLSLMTFLGYVWT
ncbi:MAG: DUF1353 domain-containing protein [Nocardioides sp.]